MTFQFVYFYPYPEICSFVEKCKIDLRNEFHIKFKEWKDEKLVSQKGFEQFTKIKVTSPPSPPGAMHKKLIANSDFENERKIAEIQKQIELEEKKARKNKTIKTRTKNFRCNVFGLLLL